MTFVENSRISIALLSA